MIFDNELLTNGALTGGRTYKAICQAVRRRLEDERRWTQLSFARRASGEGCKPLDAEATCWCLLGGFAKESNDWGLVPPQILTWLDQMLEFVYGYLGEGEKRRRRFETVGEFNDYASHSEILRFLDRCIEEFDRPRTVVPT